jgi:cell wall-associated NlpC family hydrolase
VIAYARAQLGKPYIFNTAGPDTFDCSGLTMMAWAQAGVSMPHYSGAQFSMFPHVSLNDLRPGDLVFKGPGGSAHVALVVGGGMQIAATQTGSWVKFQPINYPALSGAVRPG